MNWGGIFPRGSGTQSHLLSVGAGCCMPVGAFENPDLLLADSIPRTTHPKKPKIHLCNKGVEHPLVSAERFPVHWLTLWCRVCAIFCTKAVNYTVDLSACRGARRRCAHPARGCPKQHHLWKQAHRRNRVCWGTTTLTDCLVQAPTAASLPPS